MTWYSKLWICMAICQHLQRGAKWFLKGVNSPSLRALGFNAKLKRYIPVFGSWFHVFFTTTYGDVSIWLITRFLKWWNLSLLSRCDASVRGSFLEMDVSVVSGGGFRLGGLRCFLQVQECNVHFFYFFCVGGGVCSYILRGLWTNGNHHAFNDANHHHGVCWNDGSHHQVCLIW